MIVIANGGISVISAFSNNVGSAASIELPMYTQINTSHEDNFPTFEIGKTVNFIREKFNIKEHYSIKIKSEIPEGQGLKSSSAMTLSIVCGILRFNSIKMPDENFLSLCAMASIYNKTSLTGALDDLAASYYGGICITDNKNNKIISRSKMPDDHILVIYGKNKRKTLNINLSDFKQYSKFYSRLQSLIAGGYIFEAMMLNGYILQSATGYNSKILNFMFGHGATYAGQSGKGPAIFGIFYDDIALNSIIDDFNIDGYDIIKSRFNNHGIDIKEE